MREYGGMCVYRWVYRLAGLMLGDWWLSLIRGKMVN